MCAISQDDFENNDDVCKINHCGHIFKKNSIENWLKQNHSCPSCRHNILINSNINKYTLRNRVYYLTPLQFRTFITGIILNAMLTNISSNVSFSIVRR